VIYSPLCYTLHVSGDNPTRHQEYYDFRHEGSRTLRNQSRITSYHRTVSLSKTPKAVGLYETCNLLIPEVADTAIVLLMMYGMSPETCRGL